MKLNMLPEELRQAILAADISKTSTLLNAVSDITQRFSHQNSTVWHATVERQSKKHIQLLRTLLMKYIPTMGSNILNSQDENGLAPIHIAAIGGNIEAIQLLIAYGVDPEVKSKSINAKTPYELLEHYNHLELTHPMLEYIVNKNELRKQVQQSCISTSSSEKKHCIRNFYRPHFSQIFSRWPLSKITHSKFTDSNINKNTDLSSIDSVKPKQNLISKIN